MTGAEIVTVMGCAAALVLAARRLPTERARRTALAVGALAVVAAGLGLLLR